VVKKQRHLGRTHGGTPHTLPHAIVRRLACSCV